MNEKCVSKKNVNCETCEGRASNSVFCTLDADALQIIDQTKSVNTYKKGQYIFYTGNPASGLYCINSGVVKLESEGKAGTSHLHRVVSKGGVLGYRSLFADEEYASSAIAHEDAVVCYIPKAAVFELIKKHPNVGLSFLSHISKELRAAEMRHKNLADKEAPRRVAETVLQLKKNFPEVTWSRKEISEWADTTPETVMRSLSDFKSKGYIDLVGKKIEIKNLNAFVNFADPPL